MLIEPGDLILLSRRCGSMEPFGATLCAAAKASGGVSYDHLGLVVVDPEYPHAL